MTMDFPAPVPEIPVTDMMKALTDYSNVLGYTIDWGGDEGGIAGISRGQCRMFLTNAAFRQHYKNAGPVMTWLNVDSQEQVDDLYDLWTSYNAIIVSRPESKPWGLYEFTAADPDGNMFRVFHDVATPKREEGF